jgi:hypothetical protein
MSKNEMPGGWKPLDGSEGGGARRKTGDNTAVIVILVVVGGFGLVFIAGILAAIAIPNFLAMQLRVKRAEAPSNLDGIHTAQKQYHADHGTFIALPECPDSEPGRSQRPWVGPCTAAWQVLGWEPDEMVRCSYRAELLPGDDFAIVASCDIDGDGEPAVYRANRAEKASMISLNNVY